MEELRILLKRGKQKELVDLAKKECETWSELARVLGFSEHYLYHDIRIGRRTISEGTYEKLCGLVKTRYDGFITDRLNGNWGRLKGAKKSPRTKSKDIQFICPSPELAEIIGIVLGDGNMYRKQYALRICGSLIDEKEYIESHVKNLLKKVFDMEPGVYYHRRMNEIIMYVYSKFVTENLRNYGLYYGNKIKNDVGIPEWIMKKEKYKIACIRGLFDTDGCVFRARGKVRIEFYSAIPKLRMCVQEIMNSMGFCSTWKVKKGRNTQTYGLYSKSDVKRFINIIGFNNPKYRTKALVV